MTSSKEAQQYFRTGPPPASAQEVAEYYASLDMMAVVFDIDSETATGRPPTPNDYFADLMNAVSEAVHWLRERGPMEGPGGREGGEALQ